VQKDLVACVRNVLLFEIHIKLLEARAKLDRPDCPERHVVDAAIMRILHDRAFRESAAHMNDRISAVI